MKSKEDFKITAAKFINSFGKIIGIGILALSDFLLSDKIWFKFPVTFMINNIIGYCIMFALGYVDHMTICTNGSPLAYANKIATPAAILYNVFYFLPPFNLIFILLGSIPVFKYFVNGILLQGGFQVARWFMKCNN